MFLFQIGRQREKIAVLVFLTSIWCVALNFGYAFNLTESLPQKVFFIHLTKQLKVGNYVLFKAPIGSALPLDTLLTKQVLGGPGDIVTKVGQEFFINGKWIAAAKTHSLKGEPLIEGPTGQLKEGQYYVGTKHPDSFDSRYERIGWVTKDLIIGVAYPLW